MLYVITFVLVHGFLAAAAPTPTPTSVSFMPDEWQDPRYVVSTGLIGLAVFSCIGVTIFIIYRFIVVGRVLARPEFLIPAGHIIHRWWEVSKEYYPGSLILAAMPIILPAAPANGHRWNPTGARALPHIPPHDNAEADMELRAIRAAFQRRLVVPPVPEVPQQTVDSSGLEVINTGAVALATEPGAAHARWVRIRDFLMKKRTANTNGSHHTDGIPARNTAQADIAPAGPSGEVAHQSTASSTAVAPRPVVNDPRRRGTGESLEVESSSS
ncbi:hypothetical protein CALVIDRAFT_103666 [Calocera viscosa TUFC12733]|uniref:Defect at low temperature protein 1 n=1 Tax=Calocera viscosa (strain TUFC12733) TaxID=1330018 RepID=A0A167MNF2_CALVF|nr:hypothetical protein CALVIDRAFT_103666 [Calocera viscosa TUFC12733]